MPQPIDRRTVLKTTGGLLVGASVLAESAAAAHPLGGISVDVLQETINPEKNGLIPVEVALQTDRRGDGDGWPFSPSDTLFGVGQAFETLTEDGGQVFVTISDEFEDGVANPVRVRSVAGHDGHWVMHFSSEDLRYPEPDHWDGTLGLGVFPDGVDDFVPGDHWDSDTVRIPPRGRDN